MNAITAQIEQQKLQARTHKILISVRDVVVTFKGGNQLRFNKADIVNASNGFYIIYVEKDNAVYRYPIESIDNIIETLISDQAEEKKQILS